MENLIDILSLEDFEKAKMNKSILFLAGLWYIIKVVVLLPGYRPGALVYSKGMVL